MRVTGSDGPDSRRLGILSQALDDEDATYAEQVIESIAADEALVPTLFWFEIHNALLMGERRKRITPAGTASFLVDLALLPFEVDDLPREGLVLELAQRKQLPLATVDRALIKAAREALHWPA